MCLVRFVILSFVACLAAACGATHGMEQPSECGAPPDSSRPQFIVGYGSLMQDESRTRTAPRAGPVHPVEVRGYERGWIARAQTGAFGTTFLGVRPHPASSFNAVMYQVDEDDLRATDKRESGYCRTIVPPADIKVLESGFSAPQGGQTWIYVSLRDRAAPPSPRYPIVQSYVDVFVLGCIEQEQRFGLAGFSQRCVATTHEWSENWVNDRIYPRRPFVFEPKAAQIDRLLAAQVPDYFATMRIEGGRP